MDTSTDISRTKISVYHRITERIIQALEMGIIPWQQPWATARPVNAMSRRLYRGGNVIALQLTSLEKGYSSAGWVTFKQAKQLGGHIRQGERGTLICWYDRRRRRAKEEPSWDEEADPGWIWVARAYHVFNLDQTIGLGALQESLLGGRSTFEVRPECARVVKSSGAVIRHHGGQAYYDPCADVITMPHPASFQSPEGYYATAFHELAHWTGANHRLGREIGSRFGDERYAFEELVAELGAAFVSARCGIDHVSQASSYLGSWLTALRENCSALYRAARFAADAADYLLPAVADPEE